jgi:hypothetical protein
VRRPKASEPLDLQHGVSHVPGLFCKPCPRSLHELRPLRHAIGAEPLSGFVFPIRRSVLHRVRYARIPTTAVIPFWNGSPTKSHWTLVESRCDADSLDGAYPLPTLSVAGASLSPSCPVFTPRSSNRTCAINASGSRRKHHGFAHEKLRVRSVSRTRPNLSCRASFENLRLVPLLTLCLARNH